MLFNGLIRSDAHSQCVSEFRRTHCRVCTGQYLWWILTRCIINFQLKKLPPPHGDVHKESTDPICLVDRFDYILSKKNQSIAFIKCYALYLSVHRATLSNKY